MWLFIRSYRAFFIRWDSFFIFFITQRSQFTHQFHGGSLIRRRKICSRIHVNNLVPIISYSFYGWTPFAQGFDQQGSLRALPTVCKKIWKCFPYTISRLSQLFRRYTRCFLYTRAEKEKKKENLHFPAQPPAASIRLPLASQSSWHNQATTGAINSGFRASNKSYWEKKISILEYLHMAWKEGQFYVFLTDSRLWVSIWMINMWMVWLILIRPHKGQKIISFCIANQGFCLLCQQQRKYFLTGWKNIFSEPWCSHRHYHVALDATALSFDS